MKGYAKVKRMFHVNIPTVIIIDAKSHCICNSYLGLAKKKLLWKVLGKILLSCSLSIYDKDLDGIYT